MPAYTFTGAYPRVLTGLRQGVNARHDGTAPGATIEPQPGDTVVTDEPFEHPELAEIVRADAPVPPAPESAAPGEVVLDADALSHLSPDVLAQIQAAEHAADPAAPATDTPQE